MERSVSKPGSAGCGGEHAKSNPKNLWAANGFCRAASFPMLESRKVGAGTFSKSVANRSVTLASGFCDG